MRKPRVAVYKFSSCDGCQLSLLNLEDEILDLANAVDIAFFLEATSEISPGPYDIALVEGSISTPHEAERIIEIRKQADVVVALGTCATSGGIQALRNFTNVDDYAVKVYQHPEFLDTLATSTPISDHIKIDLELWGCPVNKYQVLEVIASLLQNRRPNIPNYSVCLDCKRAGNVCVIVAYGTPCLGPATRSGCGALCPEYGRGCYGCFGPIPNADLSPLLPILTSHERHPGEVVQLLRNFAGYAPTFREAADELLQEGK